MSELVKTLEHLQQKMQKLMVLHNKLQKEHMELLAELNEAKEVSETRRTTILELEDQLKAARLASSLSGGSEKALDIQQKLTNLRKK